MSITNGELFKALTEFNGKLGDITGTVRAIDHRMSELRDQFVKAEEYSAHYRQGVRDEIAKMVMRQTHIENDLLAVKNKVEAQEEVTVMVKTIQTKAEGAGTLGKWVVRVGIGVVSLVGWFVGVYTYLTGRPPP